MTMNDCIFLDKETGWCKKHSDWSDAMPILEYCVESPCGDYRPLKDDNLDDLISRSAAIEALTNAMSMTGYQSRAIDAVRFLPIVEAVPVVRCKDCVYFRERHVRLADGTERDYAAGEESVTADVGINVGSQCRKEEEPCFREGGDFCSRGVRKEDDHAAD